MILARKIKNGAWCEEKEIKKCKRKPITGADLHLNNVVRISLLSVNYAFTKCKISTFGNRHSWESQRHSITGNPHLVGLKTICKQHPALSHSKLFPTSLSTAPTDRTVTYASTSVTVKSEAQNQESVPKKHGSCSWCTNRFNIQFLKDGIWTIQQANQVGS